MGNSIDNREKILLLALSDEIKDIGSGRYYIKKEDDKDFLYDINTLDKVSDIRLQKYIWHLTVIDNTCLIQVDNNINCIISKDEILKIIENSHILEIYTDKDLFAVTYITRTTYGVVIVNTSRNEIIVDETSNELMKLVKEHNNIIIYSGHKEISRLTD